MKVGFRTAFEKDLRKIRDPMLLKQIREVIEAIEAANSLDEIVNLKKLKAAGNYFRIRVGDYRIGLWLDGDVVLFVRVLDRKEIYRYFP